MRGILFAGAQIEDYAYYRAFLQKGDMIICCDRGIHHAKMLGLCPNYIVGDFDSANADELEQFRQKGIEVFQFPTHKDETDLQLGIRLALEKGVDDLLIFGGIGDRFDHTLANAHLLLMLLKRGVRARLINEKNCVELIDKELTLHGKAGDIVSTIPLSMQVEGITLTGLEYPLQDYTLAIDDELVAVSNVMLADEAKITIKSGYLFVICARD